MHRNYSRWERMKVLPLTQLYTVKTWTFPYQDPIEDENKGRHKCTNGIGKIKKKISTITSNAHNSQIIKNPLSMKYKKVNTYR